MDPELAVATVFSTVDELLAKAVRRDLEITHVALCSFWHSLMGVDNKGRPTTPVLGWADTRSGSFSAMLKKRFNEAAVHDRTGAHFHSSFWPAKLLWVRKGSPDAFAATHTWMGFGDYVALQLTGKAVTSISMASATGIFDQRRGDWDNELLRYLKVRRDQLPKVAGSASSLVRKITKRWPLLTNAQLLPAIGDGAADHVGSCGIGKGRASLMVGTSAAMRVAYQGEPPKRVPQGLWCYRIDERRVILGGALSDGGNLYEWCRRNFALPTGIEEQIRDRPPASHGINVLPFFHGERSTGYREQIRGEITGLTAESDNIDVLQASMEAVGYRLAEIYERLGRVSKIKSIVASGGALGRSSVWPQVIADILGRDITLSTAQESASCGTVLLALESLGKIDSIAGLEFPEGPTLAFDPARHAAYKKGRAGHEEALSKAYGTEK
jgi:gluconokinase